jgi:hypothetical protein
MSGPCLYRGRTQPTPLFGSKEAAEKWAAARNAEGYDAIVVKAQPAK